MRTISSLPPELTWLLFDAGTRIIVLVEGDDDYHVLREWFSKSLSEVEFYACGGISNLNKLLERPDVRTLLWSNRQTGKCRRGK